MSWLEVMSNILYRVFQSDYYNHGKPVKQVMVPKGLREQVMGLEHDSVMGDIWE